MTSAETKELAFNPTPEETVLLRHLAVVEGWDVDTCDPSVRWRALDWLRSMGEEGKALLLVVCETK